MRLAGKRTLVTGAASGIGRATAQRFLDEGARVALVDRVAGDAPPGGRALAVAADVADETHVERAFAAAEQRLDGLDVVVVNAAVQLFGEDAAVHELDADAWDRTHAVNLRGAFLCAKHGVRALLAAGGGSIVFTGSPTGTVGCAPGFTAYSASKAGVIGLMRVVAADYARRGIRANAVVPGFTDTPLVRSIAVDPVERDAIVATIPLGRPGAPEDVAALMVYLASDESAYATGAVFSVDGDMTAI